MQNIREMEAQAKAVAEAVRCHVSELVGPLLKRIGELEEKLLELQKGKSENIPALANFSLNTDFIEEMKTLISEKFSEIRQPKDGESIPVEQVQAMVDSALKSALANVNLPRDGEPGRDAVHIEILPSIDVEKNVPRGTYAKHLGGLWRSFETTKGMRGWECIVDGIAEIYFEKSSDRQHTLKIIRSSGEKTIKEIDFPAMIYRGVFSGGDFVPGDTVTWAGSLWHCDEPTSDKPGEAGSKGWTLCAKKGRDGKDGLNGKDLTKGVAIK